MSKIFLLLQWPRLLPKINFFSFEKVGYFFYVFRYILGYLRDKCSEKCLWRPTYAFFRYYQQFFNITFFNDPFSWLKIILFSRLATIGTFLIFIAVPFVYKKIFEFLILDGTIDGWDSGEPITSLFVEIFNQF